MNVERLTTLIKYMERLPKKAADHFDMRFWFNADQKRNGFIKGKDDVMACGSTACALGWAATVPEFARDGLKIAAAENDVQARRPDGLTNSVRGKAFFELTGEEFEELFVPDEPDENPKDWAARARTFLEDRGEVVK